MNHLDRMTKIHDRMHRSIKTWEVLKKYDYINGGYDFIKDSTDIIDNQMPITSFRYVGTVDINRETLQPIFKWKDGYIPRIGGITLMTVYELSEAQMAELKQAYICETVDNPSYGELADAEAVDNETIYSYYHGVIFTDDDFFCSCNR